MANTWLVPDAKVEARDQEDVWNPAVVIRLTKDGQNVRVHYEGWPRKFDGVVPLHYISKRRTHTALRRCWVKTDSDGHWPAIAFVRSAASQRGIEYLATEERMVFFVVRNSSLGYEFLSPRYALPWSSIRCEDSPLKTNLMERFLKKLFDDEKPLLFKNGLNPTDIEPSVPGMKNDKQEHVTTSEHVAPLEQVAISEQAVSVRASGRIANENAQFPARQHKDSQDYSSRRTGESGTPESAKKLRHDDISVLTDTTEKTKPVAATQTLLEENLTERIEFVLLPLPPISILSPAERIANIGHRLANEKPWSHPALSRPPRYSLAPPRGAMQPSHRPLNQLSTNSYSMRSLADAALARKLK